MNTPLNILVTLNEAYIPCLNVMLTSLLSSNPGSDFHIWLLHTQVRENALADTRRILAGRGELTAVQANPRGLEGAPTTSRYPKEIYYRIFAARYLPETLERALYLDPDLVVNRPLDALYNMPMGDALFAAASHVKGLMQKMNELRLDMDESSPYINSGVLLMNLARLRREQNEADVFDYIEKHKNSLILPDQDVISALYGQRIIALDSYIYNMTERLFALPMPGDRRLTLDWIRRNTAVIHYCGRNKPWKKRYLGRLNCFYQEAEREMYERFGCHGPQIEE